MNDDPMFPTTDEVDRVADEFREEVIPTDEQDFLSIQTMKMIVKKRDILAMKEALKEAEDEFEKIAADLLSYMNTQGIDGPIRVHGKLFHRHQSFHPKIVDLPTLEAWAEEHGVPMTAFLQSSPQKLKAFCKEAISQGLPYPEGVSEWLPEEKIRMKE